MHDFEAALLSQSNILCMFRDHKAFFVVHNNNVASPIRPCSVTPPNPLCCLPKTHSPWSDVYLHVISGEVRESFISLLRH